MASKTCVDVENNNQSLREELTFKDGIFQQQLTETCSKRQIEISEIDGRLAEQYEAKLQSALHDLREQYEGQMASNRQEIEVLYDNKIKNLQSTASRQSATASAAMEELRTRIDTLTGQITDLENQNGLLASRSRDLERQLENERVRHTEDLALLEAELLRLREEMDIKVTLDLEIAAYRKLLDSEEDPLHINASGVQSTLFEESQELIDNNGEEIATSERVRRQLACSTSQHREFSGLLGLSEELHHAQG